MSDQRKRLEEIAREWAPCICDSIGDTDHEDDCPRHQENIEYLECLLEKVDAQARAEQREADAMICDDYDNLTAQAFANKYETEWLSIAIRASAEAEGSEG